MNITAETNGSSVTLRLGGRIDTVTSPQLDSAINGLDEGVTALTLDMSGVDYISSAGLRVLLSAQKKMSQLGGMKLQGVGETVMDILDMTGFTDILTIE